MAWLSPLSRLRGHDHVEDPEPDPLPRCSWSRRSGRGHAAFPAAALPAPPCVAEPPSPSPTGTDADGAPAASCGRDRGAPDATSLAEKAAAGAGLRLNHLRVNGLRQGLFFPFPAQSGSVGRTALANPRPSGTGHLRGRPGFGCRAGTYAAPATLLGRECQAKAGGRAAGQLGSHRTDETCLHPVGGDLCRGQWCYL